MLLYFVFQFSSASGLVINCQLVGLLGAKDLFSLYVLFSHFRPRDATRGNSFFQMSSYARANLRITNEKTKRKIPMRASRGLKWENKMYKLKRSIPLVIVKIGYFKIINNHLIINFVFCLFVCLFVCFFR